jgi:hypothetical protein
VSSVRTAIIVAATSVVLMLAGASAASLDSVVVSYKDGKYQLDADAYLAASREAIFVILTDYDRFGRISSAYKEYGFLDPAPDGTPIVYTRMEGCVLFFCKSMRRVERLESDAPGFIRTVTLPEQSDFKESLSEWDLTAEGDGTRIRYHLELVPAFWVPPIIGPWLLQRKLQSGGAHAVERIERLAQDLNNEQVAG